MPAGNIKGITIDIGGNTQPLTNALKDVNKTISNTQSELNAVNKLLKLDPSNVNLLTQKQELLTKQIDNTSKKLETLKEAQKQAGEALARGDEGAEEQYRELERQVIATEQNLGKLEKQSDETREALDKAGDDADNTGKDFKEAGEQSKSFQDKMQTLASVTIVIKNVAKAVSDVANKVMELGKAGAKYADDIQTMASKFSVSEESLQKFRYSAELVDVSVETFGGSLSKLTKNIGQAQAGSKKQAEAFKKLGVSITDSNGELRRAEDIFYDVIDALGEMDNETELGIVANNVLGKSYAELKPLIDKGTGALRKYGEEAEDVGYVLSDDMLTALGDLDDAMQRNQRITEGLGNQFSAGFAKSMTEAQNKLNATLANPKTQKSIQNLGEAVGNVVSALAGVAEFVIQHADGILAFIAGTAGALIAMSWQSIVSGISKAITALKGLALTPVGAIALIAGAITGIALEASKATPEVQALADTAEELGTDAKDLIEGFSTSQATLETTAKEANNLTDEIDSLNTSIIEMKKRGEDTTAQQGLLKDKVQQLNGVMGKTVATIDAQTGTLRENTKQIKENIEQIRLQAEAQAYQEHYVELKKKQIEIETEQEKVRSKWAQTMEKRNQTEFDWTFKLNNDLRELGKTYQGLSDSLTEVNGDLERTEQHLQSMPEANKQVADSVTLITDAEAYRLLSLKETNAGLTAEQEAYLATYEEYNAEQYASLEDLVKKEQELQATRLKLMQQSDSRLNTQSDVSLKERAKNIRDNTQAILKYEQNMTKLREIALSTSDKNRRDALNRMINELGDYSERSIGIINDLVTDFTDAGGKSAWGYIDAYSASFNTGAGKLNSTTSSVTSGAIDAGAKGIANNPSMTTQATRAINNTETALKSQVRYGDFASIGTSITNEIAKGIISGSKYLFDVADRIAKGLKSRLSINVVTTSGSTGTKIRGYATGGIAWTPQLATVAEREPEAIIPLSKLGNIVNGARGISGPNINVTLNAQQVTEAEAYRLTKIVSKEFARRTGNRI